MAEATETVRWYFNDLIAVYTHTLEAMRRHAVDESLLKVPGGKEAINSAVATLELHLKKLEERVNEMGGPGAVGQMKEAMTSVTGFLTGLYGQVRNQAASRILRDDYTGLSFLMTCSTMLHTTCIALGNTRASETTSQLVNELPRVIIGISNLLPKAVIADLAKDNVLINLDAAQTTIMEVKQAWERVPAPV